MPRCSTRCECIAAHTPIASADRDFSFSLNYVGDASTPFTLDAGSLGKGSSGVMMELTTGSQTKLSTTDYILYGDVEATLRHDARAGLVAAFIFMSDVQDEIDWEFATDNPQDCQTNTYALAANANAQSVNQTGSFTVSDFHTYGVNWQPNQIQWKIDGNVVRTLTKSQAGGNFPQTPSRIQFSVWAGGNATNPEGVIAWAGGAIDWTTPEYQENGYYPHEITNFYMGCADNSLANISTTGSGQNVTSWVYTGNLISGSQRPEFQLSTDPIKPISDPSAGGRAGMPGWSQITNAKVNNGNSWDGSGSSLPAASRVESSSSSSSSSGGGMSWSNTPALKYGVPIAGGVVALIIIWAIGLCCWRKRRNSKLNPTGSGITFGNVADSAAAAGAAVIGGTKASKYSQLQDADDAPMGAQKRGQGYGPAPGPSPSAGILRNTRPSNMSMKYDETPRESMDSYAMGGLPATPPSHNRPDPFARQAQATPPPQYNHRNAAAIPPSASMATIPAQYQISRVPQQQAYNPSYAQQSIQPRGSSYPRSQHSQYSSSGGPQMSNHGYDPSSYSQHSHVSRGAASIPYHDPYAQHYPAQQQQYYYKD